LASFVVRALLIALAAVTYFLPWHTAAGVVCTGFSHFRGKAAIPMLIAVIAALVAADYKRRPPEGRVPFCLGRMGFAMALVYLALHEVYAAHAYRQIEGELASARLFYIGLGALIVFEFIALARLIASLLVRDPDGKDNHEQG